MITDAEFRAKSRKTIAAIFRFASFVLSPDPIVNRAFQREEALFRAEKPTDWERALNEATDRLKIVSRRREEIRQRREARKTSRVRP